MYVTRPNQPDLSYLNQLFGSVWSSSILTNCGPLHQKLESELTKLLDTPNVSLFSNGTLALLVALKSLRLTGEVITTPYTFIATTNAICWNNLTPVFADIEADSFNLCPTSAEKLITPNTCAILPVHCYGFPCDVDGFNKLGQNYNLPVIYDASHAFGTLFRNKPLPTYGDMSTLSFHATKVFNTVEGGAIVSNIFGSKEKHDRLKNFGFVDETRDAANVLNAILSQLQCAVGLAQLPTLSASRNSRKTISDRYSSSLSHIEYFRCPEIPLDTFYNYAYYPLRVVGHATDGQSLRDKLYEFLRVNHNIFSRRYFYPIIPHFQYFSSYLRSTDCIINASKASEEVLCLPLYPQLSDSIQTRIIDAILHFHP